MTIVLPETIARAQTLVEPVLRQAVDRLPERPRLIAGYHRGWWDAEGQPVTRGAGKAIRPALTVLSAEAAGGPAELALPAAAAVELVHDFSLLHDDVMDGDTERRHQPAAWAVYGTPQALLAGDAVLALAVQVAAESPAPGRDDALAALLEAVHQLIRGQFDDLAFEPRTDIEMDACLRMEADKTAALLACAASIGARALAAPAPLVAALHRYGFELGLAFQLIDDLLGIWGEPEVTGKPVLADLRTGKRSSPVVAAMRSGTAAGEELAGLLADGPPANEADVGRAAALIEESGARDWCVAEADRRLAGALAALEETALATGSRQELEAVARFVTERDR
ncbi:MAG TPA: polyprenyl synthetase family protein [Mycobacteriales bacterium]|nr:polyprenyl synthetase family protein [Mycobacteriales bacterium]